jgi:hypothetical protein
LCHRFMNMNVNFTLYNINPKPRGGDKFKIK